MSSRKQDNEDKHRKKSNDEQASALFDAFEKLRSLDKSIDGNPKQLATMSVSTSSKSLKYVDVTPQGKFVKYETAAKLLGKKRISNLINEIEADGRKDNNDEMKKSSDHSKKTKKTSSKKTKKDEVDPITTAVIEDIWNNLSSEKIDLGYAIVGYLADGRPIIDHDIFVSLLINYGYKIDHVLAFISDFEATGSNDDDKAFPLIMLSKNMHDIYADVKPLKNNIYEDLGLEEQ